MNNLQITRNRWNVAVIGFVVILMLLAIDIAVTIQKDNNYIKLYNRLEEKGCFGVISPVFNLSDMSWNVTNNPTPKVEK